MKIYQLISKQVLPITLDEAWHFFSGPGKLPELTPKWMHFQVDMLPKGEMYQGMIATYRLKPLLGIKFTWVTEITHVKEKEYFIDEQRFGPYRFWHHEHHFKKTEFGTEVMDIVHYALPFSFLGRAAHKLSVEHKLKSVFDYRYQKLQQIFDVK